MLLLKAFYFIVSPPPSTSYTSGQGSKSSKLVIALLVIAAAWYHFGFGIIRLSKKRWFPIAKRKQKIRILILLMILLCASIFQVLSLDHNILIFQLVFTTSGFTIWICRLLTYFKKIQYSKHKKTNKSAFKSTLQKLIESKSHTNKVLKEWVFCKKTKTKRQHEH